VDRKLDDETLMRFLDGELSPDEARDAQRAVAADPELRAKADALGQLGALLTARYAASEDDADARLAGLWEKIQPNVSAAPASERAGARASWWTGVRDWFEGYRSHFLTGAVAAAAGAVIATFIAGHPRPGERPSTLAAEVESLEVADGTAAVLQVPGERAGEITTMIWITPETSNWMDEGPI
jgi:anti-sigma-K factor RskA